MVYPKDGEVLPIKPLLFDKANLSKPDFANYLYEIEFKKSGKKVRDMSLAGYIHAIAPYLKSVHSELLHYGMVGDRKIVSAVVRSTIVVSYRTSAMSGCLNDMTFQALADGDVTNVPSFDTLVRTVETRALKRAIARALDISKVDMNSNFVDEEEIGTPLNKNDDYSDKSENAHKPAFRKSPQEIAKEKQRRVDDNEAALDEEFNMAAQDPHSGSIDSDW
jgi:hypothetical protein